jgi:hypothetical protein
LAAQLPAYRRNDAMYMRINTDPSVFVLAPKLNLRLIVERWL